MPVRWIDSNSTSPGENNQKVQVNNLKGKVINKNRISTTESLKSDLYLALIPLYHISKICGIFPVKMKSIGGGLYTGNLHTATVIYSYMLGLAFISFQVWGLRRELRNGWQNSTRLSSQTALTVTCCDVMTIIIVVSSSIFSSPFRWKYLQKAMNTLAEVDEKIGTLAVKRLQRITVALISFPLAYLIVISMFDYEAWKQSSAGRKSKLQHDKGPINYSPLYFMYFSITVFEIQYALSTFHIAERFSRLNGVIKKLIENNQINELLKKNSRKVSDTNKQEKFSSIIASDFGYFRSRQPKTFNWITSENKDQNLSETISELMSIHGNLCNAATFINSAFGMPLLVGMLGFLLHLVITPYFLYTEIKQDNFKWQILLTQTYWVVFHIVRLFIIVQPSYKASMQAKETATLVSQLLTLKWDSDIRKQFEIFSLQLLHRSLSFSACGLFSLDRALVTSIAGAVTTYVVILVQFQNEDDCSQGAKNLKNATDIIFKNASLLKTPKAQSENSLI